MTGTNLESFWRELHESKKRDRARRIAVRGKSICACCFNPVFGDVDYPSAEDCAGFFYSELDKGDAICFWCIEDWCVERNEQTVHGRA